MKSYNVISTDGGATATLSSGIPFYWERTNETKTITAWHPYSDTYPTSWTVKADQSTTASYQASDLVRGELNDLAFADRNDPSKNKMTFFHQTAKVMVNLNAGNGVTLDANASVKLLNIDGVENGNTITLYKPDANENSYLALLNGQEIRANTSFIQVETEGNTFLYKPQTSKTLQAGTAYTYNITVKANCIEVTEATVGEWTSGGSEDVAGKAVSEKYTADKLKFGDYFYSDGTWSDGGLRTVYEDGTMKIENPKPVPVSGKTVVGIVFHAGQHPNDQSDYTLSGIGQKQCHGYAVALQDATTDWCMWGGINKELGCYPKNDAGNKLNNVSNPDIDWSGYNWTQTIITAVGGKNSLNATDPSGYPATYYAVVDYESKVSAPAKSSGWFLPSIGQLRKVHQLQNYLFDFVNGSSRLDKKDGQYDGYWSSSEYYNNPNERALRVRERISGVRFWYKNDNGCNIRAVLAF